MLLHYKNDEPVSHIDRSALANDEIINLYHHVILEFQNNQDRLLKVASLGSAEMAIQGELLFGLRQKNYDVVMEYNANYTRNYHGKVNVDIMSFSQGRPSCAIELKHNIFHQGINTLKNRLAHDNDRFRLLPLIQVGAYTWIDSITNVNNIEDVKNKLKYYSTIRTYCFDKNEHLIGCNNKIAKRLQKLRNWADGIFYHWTDSFDSNDFTTQFNAYDQDGTIATVAGRVHFFVGLRYANDDFGSSSAETVRISNVRCSRFRVG